MPTYRASLSKGRSGWCVIFTHPLLDGSGGLKKRVRRGLGTRDETAAQILVDQLNNILQSPEFWSPSNRQSLEAKFDPKIVNAFLDGVGPASFDPWTDRNKIIPIPGKDQGYAVIQTTGATASGKTTLLRQMIGTDPKTERFPSTSAAKTTTCDIEVIMGADDYRAAVSFLPRDHVTQLVADCIAASAFTFMESGSTEDAERRFLEHSDQKFRLNYLLGDLRPSVSVDSEEDDSASEEDIHEDGISTEERDAMGKFLRDCIDRVAEIARRLTKTVAEGLGQPISELAAKDKDAFEEIAEAELLKDESFHQLVDEVVEEIERRFEEVLPGSELKLGRDGWPYLWKCCLSDRQRFLKTVNRFSSNYAPHFGKLLTPLVQGIRVEGPFKPDWHVGPSPKLVLLDGQGIGHTSDSTSSVSTSITKRYGSADVILLVDNAAQPMQAASQAVLTSVVSSGHSSKLVVCFTHFDEVRGDNLTNVEARKNHVKGSFDNSVRGIGKSLGRDAETSLRRLVPDRLLFLSKIHETLTVKNTLSTGSLEHLLDFAAAAIRPVEPDEFCPVYDVANLIIAIQRAAQQFQARWSAKLGFAPLVGEDPEPWQRIKALARRIAHFHQDEYDTLRPVADLVKDLQEEISQYLAAPLSWTPSIPNSSQEEKRLRALDSIRQRVFEMLHAFSTQRLIQSHLTQWVTAYDYRGQGSTRSRARDIRGVYEAAAPIPANRPGEDGNDFLFDVRSLVQSAITSSGGEVVGWRQTAE